MKFEKLEQGTTNEVETRYSQKWDEMDILEKTIENRKGHDDFVFYDGPATANGILITSATFATQALSTRRPSEEAVIS